MKTVGMSWLRKFSSMQGTGRSAASGQATPLSPEPCGDLVCPAAGASLHPLPHGTSLRHCSSPARDSSMSENLNWALAGLLQALAGLFPPHLGKKITVFNPQAQAQLSLTKVPVLGVPSPATADCCLHSDTGASLGA